MSLITFLILNKLNKVMEKDDKCHQQTNLQSDLMKKIAKKTSDSILRLYDPVKRENT